tara:strand:- start:521 stop:1153 length:633 start_codon:yes stop_codon:yes gene_type:complete
MINRFEISLKIYILVIVFQNVSFIISYINPDLPILFPYTLDIIFSPLLIFSFIDLLKHEIKIRKYLLIFLIILWGLTRSIIQFVLIPSFSIDNNLSADAISSNFSMFTYNLISLIFLSSLFIFIALFYFQFNYRPIFPIFTIYILINFIISFIIFIIATLNYQVSNTIALENIAIFVSIKLFLMPFLALTAYFELFFKFKFKIIKLNKTI